VNTFNFLFYYNLNISPQQVTKCILNGRITTQQGITIAFSEHNALWDLKNARVVLPKVICLAKARLVQSIQSKRI